MNLPILEFCFMVGVDILFLGVLVFVMLAFGMWRQAAFAVMKRNFVGYFSNPTGYVFLCLFVLLTSFAAFWPHEFFTTNLANFDQLNRFLPYIMLVFIPAITMSVWSEERRQGTDELLLTLPAHDFDIVIGKYFAAVLVFTVSLLFSQLSNYAVLISMTGGDLDSGLLFSTYLGYWFVGVAMLAIGMVASFLTNNLTVGFIFGVVFNAPLAFFSNADVIISDNATVSRLFEWSLLQRFDPFGRGLITLSSICYFVGLALIGIYLSMVLIGRRHWQGGKHGTSLLGHYIVRTFLLCIIAVAVVLIAQYSPASRARMDVSRNKISTLTENTRKILSDLQQTENEQENPPIIIDAYVGSSIPADFVQTRYDLVNLLREFDVMGGNRIRVNLRTNVEPFSQEAINAEKRFGIKPRPYVSESRGAVRREQVILGAAFTSGLNREVIEFFPYGSQVEYELIRSIDTVAQQKRATIGVAETDAFPAGGFLQIGGQSGNVPPFAIIEEFKKQYNVQSVNLGEPIEVWSEGASESISLEALDSAEDLGPQLQYDVMLVIQPSKMTPNELENLMKAIEAGQPTVIFEDPAAIQPSLRQRVLGTPQPRLARMPRGGTAETPQINNLWRLLGISMSGIQSGEQFIPNLVWQRYNPYRRDSSLDVPERLVIDNLNPALQDTQISGAHPATSGIEELVFNYASAFSVPSTSLARLDIEPLVVARSAGTINLAQWSAAMRGSSQAMDRARGSEREADFILAAHIKSREESGGKINCIYVTDVDVLSDEMLQVRDSPIQRGVEYRYQNVAFVLNLVDSMTSRNVYIPIRDRRPKYVTLRVVENTIKEATEEVDKQLQAYEIEFENRIQAAQGEMAAQTEDLKRQVDRMVAKARKNELINKQELDLKQQALAQQERSQQEKMQRIAEEMQNERNEKVRTIRLSSELKIQEIQRRYKLAAVLIPPIPPLLLGLFVFTRRRLKEREGISKARRLK